MIVLAELALSLRAACDRSDVDGFGCTIRAKMITDLTVAVFL